MNTQPVIIIRHYKERESKCSVEPLKGKEGYIFRTFRKNCLLDLSELPDLSEYIRLDIDGDPLCKETDSDKGILLIDGTWRYSGKIIKFVKHVKPRRLMLPWKTAYPRRQQDASDPVRGLASIEALFAACHELKRPTDEIFDDYYWRDEFLALNSSIL